LDRKLNRGILIGANADNARLNTYFDASTIRASSSIATIAGAATARGAAEAAPRVAAGLHAGACALPAATRTQLTSISLTQREFRRDSQNDHHRVAFRPLPPTYVRRGRLAIAGDAVNTDWNATALGGANAENILCVPCFIVPR
jgi:hypothetical protein